MRFLKSIATVALCAVVAACAEQSSTGYQGWVEADLIFVFDRTNYTELIAQVPAARAKTHYIGALAKGGSVAIADPYGHSVEDFRACYAQIAHSIEALAAAAAAARPAQAVAPGKLVDPSCR